MDPATSQVLSTIGYIMLIIAIIANIVLYFKATSEEISETSLILILITYIVLLIVGLVCVYNKSAFFTITIILLVIGGLSLVTFLIKAFSENVNKLGIIGLILNTIINIGGGFLLLLNIIPSM
jgi:hypothetical protein